MARLLSCTVPFGVGVALGLGEDLQTEIFREGHRRLTEVAMEGLTT